MSRSRLPEPRRWGGFATEPVTDALATKTGQLPAVQTLGRFRVLPTGTAVAVEWQSNKAKDLLKLLIARRGRPIARETLIDQLWPGDDPRRCANRLSVALSTIRSVLDPDRHFPTNYFIGTDRYSVGITHLRVDVEEFLTTAREALTGTHGNDGLRTGAYRRAAAMYTGDFLEQDPHRDWAVSLREEAKAVYLELLRTLAVVATRARSYDHAVRYQLRILERDHYDEQAHLGLVSVLIGSARYGEAIRRYQLYVSRMAEIGIEPAPIPGGR